MACKGRKQGKGLKKLPVMPDDKPFGSETINRFVAKRVKTVRKVGNIYRRGCKRFFLKNFFTVEVKNLNGSVFGNAGAG